VLKKVGEKKPWKYIDAVAVEGVTFGLSPPQFQFANAKYDPARQHLQIQLNLRYNSSGFQAVVGVGMCGGEVKAFLCFNSLHAYLNINVTAPKYLLEGTLFRAVCFVIDAQREALIAALTCPPPSDSYLIGVADAEDATDRRAKALQLSAGDHPAASGRSAEPGPAAQLGGPRHKGCRVLFPAGTRV